MSVSMMWSTLSESLRSAAFLAIFGICGCGLMAGVAEAQLYNPCPYVNDGDCDEPNGLGYCAWGTDTADCSNPNSNFGAGSGSAGGGGTAGISGGGGGLYNPCPYLNDGDCDEPNGLGYCAWGTDTADCANPNSNFGGGSGYNPGSGGRPVQGGVVQGGVVQEIDTSTNFFGELCTPGMRPFAVERGRQAALFRIIDLSQISQQACPNGGAAISVYSGNPRRQIASFDLYDGGVANRLYALELPAGDYMLHFTYPTPARLRLQFTTQ